MPCPCVSFGGGIGPIGLRTTETVKMLRVRRETDGLVLMEIPTERSLPCSTTRIPRFNRRGDYKQYTSASQNLKVHEVKT